MKITDRIYHIEAEIAANPKQPAITIPVGSVKTLIRHHNEYAELQEKMTKYRTEALYYREMYASAKDTRSPRYNRPWTEEESTIVANGKRTGLSNKEIAAMLDGRTPEACHTRWHKMIKKQLV